MLEFISVEDALLITVSCDMLGCLLLYFCILCMKSFMAQTKNDINSSMLTADDFTVLLKDMPLNPDKQSIDLKELKANVWVWADNILKIKDKGLKLDNP